MELHKFTLPAFEHTPCNDGPLQKGQKYSYYQFENLIAVKCIYCPMPILEFDRKETYRCQFCQNFADGICVDCVHFLCKMCEITNHSYLEDHKNSVLHCIGSTGTPLSAMTSNPMKVHWNHKYSCPYFTPSPVNSVIPAHESSISQPKLKYVIGKENGAYFLGPMGVCSDKNGRMFLVDSKRSLVIAINKFGKTISSFGLKGSGEGQMDNPSGVACYNRRVVIADRGNHRIQIYRYNGNFLYGFGGYGDSPGFFKCPSDVCITSKRQILVSDTNNQRVQMFDKNGNFLTMYRLHDSMADGPILPMGVVVTQFGRILLTDTTQRRLIVVHETLNTATVFGKTCPRSQSNFILNGIAINRTGLVFIANYQSSTICAFNYLGRYLGAFKHEVEYPSGICIGRDGGIVISDNKGKVFVYESCEES